jgi:hypothetical protein
VPFLPHCVLLVPTWQAPATSQQPPAQLVASQTHPPLTQRWPTPHALPVPHLQAPLVHRSDFESQVAHVLAAAPQAAGPCAEGARHCAPEQQPPGHELALQTHAPPTQV